MTWLGRRAVITGGAGFLGSHLCEALLARGASVTVVDDFSVGSMENLVPIISRIKIVRHRLGDSSEAIGKDLAGDVLFYLAALADPRQCKEDFDTAFRGNVLGLKTCLASRNQYARVVYTSSAWVYGDPEYIPIDEAHPLKGKDPYSITKIMGEWLCKHYAENEGRSVAVVRNFNIFGPRQAPGYLIPTLIGQALCEKRIEIWNGDPIRDLIYVSDAVEALLAVASTHTNELFTVNMGAGRRIRVRDLADGIANLFGVPVVDLQKSVIGSTELVCNNAKLASLTGWTPKVSLEKGLEQTIQWYRECHGSKPVLS